MEFSTRSFMTLIILILVLRCETTKIQRKYGYLNPYFNQTSYGYLRFVVGSDEVNRLPTIWMQDDLHKRMRIDVGQRGNPGFVAEFYFFQNFAYEVNADQYGNIYCIKIPDFNYSSEISTYGEPNFGFLGRHVLQEYGGITADLYVGQAVDGVGPMNCIFYCDAETCSKYLGLTVVGSANRFSFLEYWYGDNLTSAIPPAAWFALPPECNRPEIYYYFDQHNADGTLKEQTPSPSSSDAFCSLGNNNDMSLVLYRSVCCDQVSHRKK